MFELLNEISEFLGERERENTVKVEWKTQQQQRQDIERENDLAFAKAIYRRNTETDPETKSKIAALITAGIYDIDKYIDKI